MQKIEIKPLPQQVADQIREMIRKGRLIRGQKIDEKFLCDSMGVSRTPVRESLRILHSEGLIDLIPHKGAYISQPPIEDIKDMFQVMSVLEGMCARLASQNMKEKEFKKIEALHEKLECHYRNRNHEEYLDINSVLHMFIQELSGNKTLNEVITGLRYKILLYRHRQLYHKDRFDQSMQEHRGILEAFRKRDADLAEASMKRHLLKQCEALMDLYTSKEGRDGEPLAA
ncbi:MAG: GntR family transcriptional regulator [Desulfobacteraceae bacterium]|jgi:DNA-binding GntR family transcriptional regulator